MPFTIMQYAYNKVKNWAMITKDEKHFLSQTMIWLYKCYTSFVQRIKMQMIVNLLRRVKVTEYLDYCKRPCV